VDSGQLDEGGPFFVGDPKGELVAALTFHVIPMYSQLVHEQVVSLTRQEKGRILGMRRLRAEKACDVVSRHSFAPHNAKGPPDRRRVALYFGAARFVTACS